MKRLLSIAVFIAVALPSRGAEPLTAEELAYHLGVRSWVSELRLEGIQYKIELLHVVSGKVVNSLLITYASPTNRELTRVAILATPSQSGTQVSIRAASGAAVARRAATIPLDITIPLPPLLTAGDYVIGGDVPEEALIGERPSPTITQLKNGLLLRITKGD